MKNPHIYYHFDFSFFLFFFPFHFLFFFPIHLIFYIFIFLDNASLLLILLYTLVPYKNLYINFQFLNILQNWQKRSTSQTSIINSLTTKLKGQTNTDPHFQSRALALLQIPIHQCINIILSKIHFPSNTKQQVWTRFGWGMCGHRKQGVTDVEQVLHMEWV